MDAGGLDGLGLVDLRQVVVGDRRCAGRVLQQSVEQRSASERVATVEPERELVQVCLQVLVLHPALMDAQQPAFEQRRDPVHPGQQVVDVGA